MPAFVPSETEMNVFIAIGAAHALYLMVLVITKRRKLESDYLLIAYFGTFLLTLGTAYISFQYDIEDLLLLHLNNSLLLAPLFFLYIASLTRRSGRRLVHLIPFLLTSLYWLYFLGSTPEAGLNRIFSETDDAKLPLLFMFALLLEALAIPVYVAWALLLFRRHKKAIANTFSFTEGIDLRWAYVLTVCTGIFWLTMVASEALGTGIKVNTATEDARTGYALATLFLFVLGYFGIRQGTVFSDLEPHKPDPKKLRISSPKYVKSGLDAETQKKFAEQLTTYLASEQPYLKSRLSVNDLSEALNIPAHYLSQVINIELQTTFYDLINQHRVNEFKRRATLSSHKHFTLMAVAFECGFNSKASFNRIFKKFESCTPTAYLKQFHN